MEESNDNVATASKKRARVESVECDSESKRIRDAAGTDELLANSVVSGFNSLETGLMSNDILEILDDQNATTDGDVDIPDLDLVIRSFEEEILPVPESADLGYLLEASDDELGLPPAVSSPTNEQLKTEPCYDSFGLENEFPSYDPFEYGLGMENQFVDVGGLYEYSDESSDFSEFLWRPEKESLPAM
ncbi:hypothetical protein L1887_14729 [Cichorium endivia]|nr:hypothetical protein L1887_14729 [Cichorium endivia]